MVAVQFCGSKKSFAVAERQKITASLRFWTTHYYFAEFAIAEWSFYLRFPALLKSRGVASFAKSGGGGKIKIRGAKLKTSVELSPNFHYSWIGLRQIFGENQVISKKKKKVFAEIRRLFLAEITILNVFSGQKQQLFSPKKIPWGAKTKIGGQCPCPPAGDTPAEKPFSLQRSRAKKYCTGRTVSLALHQQRNYHLSFSLVGLLLIETLLYVLQHFFFRSDWLNKQPKNSSLLTDSTSLSLSPLSLLALWVHNSTSHNSSC